jgi:hypothetical protein
MPCFLKRRPRTHNSVVILAAIKKAPEYSICTLTQTPAVSLMTSHAVEERNVHAVLTVFGGADGVRVGCGDFCEVLCYLNRSDYDLTPAQLQAIFERCAAWGKVTRRFDSGGAGAPLLITPLHLLGCPCGRAICPVFLR